MLCSVSSAVLSPIMYNAWVAYATSQWGQWRLSRPTRSVLARVFCEPTTLAHELLISEKAISILVRHISSTGRKCLMSQRQIATGTARFLASEDCNTSVLTERNPEPAFASTLSIHDNKIPATSSSARAFYIRDIVGPPICAHDIRLYRLCAYTIKHRILCVLVFQHM